MAKASLVVVLAEDRRHQQFAWHYLKRMGYERHDLRLLDLPAGRGCGEQWVRERYASAVRAYRWRSAQAETALVVLIDADRDDCNRRLKQFQDALKDTGDAPRAHEEEIAHLIPKRSIETWVLCLNGRSVDEDTDYSREDLSGMIPGAAVTFFEWTRQNFQIPEHCVTSLRMAVPEARRLE